MEQVTKMFDERRLKGEWTGMGDPIKNAISDFEKIENWENSRFIKVESYVYLLTVFSDYCYTRKGDSQRALFFISRAIDLMPNYFDAISVCARIFVSPTEKSIRNKIEREISGIKDKLLDSLKNFPLKTPYKDINSRNLLDLVEIFALDKVLNNITDYSQYRRTLVFGGILDLIELSGQFDNNSLKNTLCDYLIQFITKLDHFFIDIDINITKLFPETHKDKFLRIFLTLPQIFLKQGQYKKIIDVYRYCLHNVNRIPKSEYSDMTLKDIFNQYISFLLYKLPRNVYFIFFRKPNLDEKMYIPESYDEEITYCLLLSYQLQLQCNSIDSDFFVNLLYHFNKVGITDYTVYLMEKWSCKNQVKIETLYLLSLGLYDAKNYEKAFILLTQIVYHLKQTPTLTLPIHIPLILSSKISLLYLDEYEKGIELLFFFKKKNANDKTIPMIDLLLSEGYIIQSRELRVNVARKDSRNHAIEILKSSLNKNPKLPKLFAYHLSLSMAEDGNITDSINLIKHTINMSHPFSKDDLYIYSLLILLLTTYHEYMNAFNFLKAILDRFPDNPLLLYIKVFFELYFNNEAAAIETLNQCFKYFQTSKLSRSKRNNISVDNNMDLDPNNLVFQTKRHYTSYYDMLHVYCNCLYILLLPDSPNINNIFSETQQLACQSRYLFAYALSTEAQYYVIKKNYSKAEELFRQSILIDSDNETTLYFYANYLYNQYMESSDKNPEKLNIVISLLKSILTINNYHANAWKLMGQCYESLKKNYEEATEFLFRSVECNKISPLVGFDVLPVEIQYDII